MTQAPLAGQIPWTSYLLVSGATLALFLLAWPLLVRRRREAWVDAMWSLAIPVVAGCGALLASGWWPRRLLAVLLPAIWGGRLAAHLLHRLRRDGSDGRYAAMREALGARHFRAMGPFFLVQGVLAAILALPWWAVASHGADSWLPLEWIGAAVWLLGLGGTALADRQLAGWRNDSRNHGRTCRAGLWAWSRHPNYFFEWVAWCGVALIAWTAPSGWIGALVALLLLLLVTRVSGIPFTERQALRSRGDDYRKYQREVSSFIPLPPRRTGA